MTSLTDETTGAVFDSPEHQAELAELYRDFDAERYDAAVADP